MLESLSVKNFALIKEAHIDFKNNLNVLTGETGSGKSILIGSLGLALGKRASKEYMRDDNEDTVVTIAFSIKNPETIEFIKSLDIPVDDGNVIIYRKVTKDKNIIKINDEPATLNKVKEVTEKLIDIYGQHDGEELRKGNMHIEFLDEFIGEESIKIKKEISSVYDELKIAKEKLASFDLDERMKKREIDILKYEVEELENAELKVGEESSLAERFKLASNSKDIVENINNAINLLQETDVTKAIKAVKDAARYDSSLENVYESLVDADSIISDSVKELDKKLNMYDIDEKDFATMEERLNLIRSILSKYDNSVEKANKELVYKKQRLTELEDYDNEKMKAENNVAEINKKLMSVCKKLSDIRKEKSKDFTKKLIEELKDLGFLDVKFDIEIKEKNEVTRDGFDDVTFMISLNTGEKMRPLSDVASGGELSRIMLSIKTILSESFGTDTLIFDEIDAGISGITASKVATKLNKISRNRQTILITHLPQIAAMGDTHFVIKKEVEADRTLTKIDELDEKGMINEIGRLISSSGNLSENVIANAKELKELARKEKV